MNDAERYDPKERASLHFKWSELAVSASRPDLAERAARDWTPWTRQNAKTLLRTVVEPLRAHIGKPFQVLSCYRPIYLNRAVGSRDTSQHLTASAIDFRPIPHTQPDFYKIFAWCWDNPIFGQAIFYFRGELCYMVHLSLPGNKKGEILTSRGGRYRRAYPTFKANETKGE